MKIKGTITAVEDIGGQLKITLQGAPIIDCIKDLQKITFLIPGFERNLAGFHVGRKISLKVTVE